MAKSSGAGGKSVAYQNRLNETKMILRQPLLLLSIIASFLLLILFLILAAAGATAGILLENYVLIGIGAVALIGAAVAAVRLAADRKKLHQFRQKRLAVHEEMD